MEKITSRQNGYIKRLRALASNGELRRREGEFVCCGAKLFEEAVRYGGHITSVLWRDEPKDAGQGLPPEQFCAPPELFDYASPQKNSPGPVFTVKLPSISAGEIRKAIVLQGVQDPGNVGTVIRTASAFSMDAVVLTDGCADPFSPKTVRAAMGATFRQKIIETGDVAGFLKANGLRMYGAALSPRAMDIRKAGFEKTAVAIGSEGRGLSREMLELCENEIIIPMAANCESLNAAAAAAVVMWEMSR